MGRPSKREKQKPNCSITFLPKEKKRKSKLFWGDSGENWNPTSSGDCSIISASSPDSRYLFIPSIFNLSLSSSLHPFLPSPSISSRKLFCALPLFYLSISPEPFLSLSHLSTRKLPLLLLLQPFTRKLACSFCFLFFFLINSKGRSLDLPLRAPYPLPTVPCSTSSFPAPCSTSSFFFN